MFWLLDLLGGRLMTQVSGAPGQVRHSYLLGVPGGLLLGDPLMTIFNKPLKVPLKLHLFIYLSMCECMHECMCACVCGSEDDM